MRSQSINQSINQTILTFISVIATSQALPGYFSSGLIAVREPHSASITVQVRASL
jgi:hypothetical protein